MIKKGGDTMTKNFMVRNVPKDDLLRLDTLTKMKGYKSREEYIRKLIHRDVNEEFELHSIEQYLDLVQQLLVYLSIQSRRIEEHNELTRDLINLINQKK